MENKRKQYLFDDQCFLTKYTKTRLRNSLKSNEEEINENPSTASTSSHDNRGDNIEVAIDTDVHEAAEEKGEQLVNFLNIPDELPLTRESLSFYDCEINNFLELFPDTTVDEEEHPLYEDLYSSDEEISARLVKETKKTNIGDFVNEEQFFKSISINSQRSPAELLLMILKYCISNRLSTTGLTNLVKLVNYVFGTNILPETRYKISQLCNPTNNVTLHAVCQTCLNYVGTFGNFVVSRECGFCNTPVDMSNPSNRCFFATIDPSDALRDYLQAHDRYYKYVVSEREHLMGDIQDIYDGQLYRQFLDSLSEDERHAYATVTFNTDGAPVFESSKCSVWPIYISLNEIPPQHRFKSAITAGLWFGLNKPVMTVFLDVFVDQMNDLSTKGINCTIQTEECIIKIFPLVASVDSQARFEMNGSSQYNAHYGCDWCLHYGEHYAGSMRYPYKIPHATERDHFNTIAHATEAVKLGKRIFGIKTASSLLNLKKFDIIEGFTPDYMHFYLIGVVQQFTDLLLGYLQKTDIDFINCTLTNIKAPTQISRLSRSLEHRGYWKAREYENWALYYSLPLISIVLKNKQIIQHWSLLVDALHICLGKVIRYSDLNRANEMLHKFVEQTEDIYSLASLTYNVHQLLHMCKSIQNWGPLWTHSTFPFESANHRLLTAVHSSKGVIIQIARFENIQRCVQNLENKIYPDCPEVVMEYCEKVSTPLSKKAYKLSNITYIGKEKPINYEVASLFNIPKKAKTYSKIIFEGCVFTSSRKENKRSCNSFAQLIDGRYAKLTDFIVDNNKEVTVCQLIITKPNVYSTVIREVSEFSELFCIETNEISKTCIFIAIDDDNMFITPLPNQLHY